jgi:hypothetical protein
VISHFGEIWVVRCAKGVNKRFVILPELITSEWIRPNPLRSDRPKQATNFGANHSSSSQSIVPSPPQSCPELVGVEPRGRPKLLGGTG